MFLEKSFYAERQGNVAIVFGLALSVLMGFVGSAVDVGNFVRYATLLQTSVDGAAIAVATARANSSELESQTIGQAYIEANWTPKANGIGANLTFADNGQGLITVTTTISMPTTFLRLFGYSELNGSASAAAQYGAGSAEVALVLDNTGSMTGAKIAALQTSASALIDVLYRAPGADQIVKVGLVPFTYYVNVGLNNRSASWLSVASDSSVTTQSCATAAPLLSQTCVPTSGTCYTDGVSYACAGTSCTNQVYGPPVYQCSPVTTAHTWYGCAGSRNFPLDMQDLADGSNKVPGVMDVGCPSPLARLTTDKVAIKAQITAMTAGGETYIAPGLLWGWRVLSPNAPFADGAPYDHGTRKIMVMMTDGANTHSPNYPDHENTDVGKANALTAQTCSAIKAAGIELYTIAFSVTDPTAISMLQACSSGPVYFYNAHTVADLATAFRTIGNGLTQVRLVR